LFTFCSIDPTLGLAKFDYQKKTIDDWPKEFEKYQWHVSMLLNACEEILALTKGESSDWNNSMSSNIALQKDYMTAIGLAYVEENYKPEFYEFCRRACA
jgi:hypothetical protein